MISIALIAVFMIGVVLSVGFWLTELASFKKTFPFMIIAIFSFVILILLPKPDSHLEKYTEETKVIVEVPKDFKVVTYKITSNSKWMWAKNEGRIIYKVEKK